MKRKTTKFLLVALVLALSVLSINTLIFSVRLFRLSFGSFQDYEKENEALAKNYLRNKKLAPLVREKYVKSDFFLASFMAELIADDKVYLLNNEYKGLLNNVIQRFPENIFLAQSGFYGEEDPAKDWENFDALALKLMRESRFKSLVFPLLIQYIEDKEIPESSLPPLITYLAWMKNLSLAEDFLAWAFENKKIGDDVFDSLRNDLNLRGRRRPKDKNSGFKNPLDSSFVIPFGNKDLKVDAGRDLIFPRKSRKADSLKEHWIFSDISDTDSYAKGSFYGHIDNLENKCLRVMGFFTKYFPGLGFANGGLQLKKRILLDKSTYLFHFRYRTSGQSEIPSFWLAHGIKKAHRLEPADSDWKEVFYLFDNSHFKLPQIQPLLRMFGTGSVWFDDIGFYRIEVKGQTVEQDVLIIQ